MRSVFVIDSIREGKRLCSVILADQSDPVTYYDPAPAPAPAPAPSSSTSSSGTSSTGSGAASAATPGVAAAAGPINIGLRIAAAGIGIAWGPARPVHDGAVVEVYPIPANTMSVFVGTDGDPNCFQSSSRNVEVPKGAPMMVFPIENLGSLIVKNQVAGEGIVVRIRNR